MVPCIHAHLFRLVPVCLCGPNVWSECRVLWVPYVGARAATGPVTWPINDIFPADDNKAWGEEWWDLLNGALGWEHYNILTRSPEWDGNASQRVLKNRNFLSFLRRIGGQRYKYYVCPGDPCNSSNVLYDFWQSYTGTMVLLRDSAVMGREPFCQVDLEYLDTSIRKQRVWLGVIAPHNAALQDQFHMWSHTYFFHIMWYVKKYGGVGSLTQQPIEMSHKEVHKDVAVWTVAGTRPAHPEDWKRVMRGYNIDLVRLMREGKLRNGGDPQTNWCICYGADEPRVHLTSREP